MGVEGMAAAALAVSMLLGSALALPRFTVVETRPVTNYTLPRIPGVVETFSAELDLIGNAARSIDVLAMYCEFQLRITRSDRAALPRRGGTFPPLSRCFWPHTA